MFMQPSTVVWIAGANGRLGGAIESALDKKKYLVIPTDKEVDITNLDVVNDYVSGCRPDYIINCAAMAKKEDADKNPDEAYRVNALGARNLAIAAAGSGATLVHLSTDDVFPGVLPHKVNEFDKTIPPHVYGKSKEAGEQLVRDLCPHHIIVRSSWVYTFNDDDLIDQYTKSILAGENVYIATNQYACPTSAKTLADFIIAAIESGEFGIFHAVCTGICSRYEFAKTALELMGVPTNALLGKQDPGEGYRIELDNLMMRLTGVFEMPAWQDDLKQRLAEEGRLH